MQLERIDPFHIVSDDSVESGAVCISPSSFLQTPFWASFKEQHGWTPIYFRLNAGSGPVFLTVLVRRLGRFASIAYIPLGPAIDEVDPLCQGRILADLSALLVSYLPSNTLCIRFDPPWGTTEANCASTSADTEDAAPASAKNRSVRPPLPVGVREAPAHIQPPDTVILDLTKSEETLLAEMKGKWRYNIRLGEKKGVTVRYLEGEQGATEGIDIFYGLYLDTAKRDGIAIHSKNYYADLMRRGTLQNGTDFPFTGKLSVRVYVAEFEGSALASIVTLFCGDEAVYLYGASSNEKRNLMPAYSLQWQAIRDAKDANCNRYDFYGIPPVDDPSHPMYGLYRFKTGFGGSIVHRTGSVDLPLRPFLYAAYRLAEAGRALWYKKLVKLFRRETPRRS